MGKTVLGKKAKKQPIQKQKLWSLAVMILVLVTGVFVGFLQLQPPSPPAESDANYASYQRMLKNLEIMTKAPHISGSKELEAVRAHILAEIMSMDLKPSVEGKVLSLADIEASERERSKNVSSQSSQSTGPSTEAATCSGGETDHHLCRDAVFDSENKLTLKNIVTKLDAPNTDKGVLMMAHYDTEPGSPGAADDMVSVAALLEAMRKQAKNTDLKNDIYVVFTDGEELGALGAQAFLKNHPELKNHVSHVVNLEARGNRGGLLMFETSGNNYDLMRYFTSAASTPIAFSFTSELYKRMPNGTDMTDFLKAGYSGLNFAVGEGIEHYHSPTDTFENLNRNTAYQFLLTALEMSDAAATSNFKNTSQQSSVYFPFWPYNLVVMSKTAAYILSTLAVISGSAWLVWVVRRKQVSLKRIIISSAWLVGTVAVAAIASGLVTSGIMQAFDMEDSSNTEVLFLTLASVVAIGTIGLHGFLLRKRTFIEALAGIFPVLLLLVIVSTLFLNTASYLFVLPTIALVGVALLERFARARLIVSVLAGVAILLLFVPVCWLIYVLFMLAATPLVVALGILPLAILTALFASTMRGGKIVA